MSLYTHDITQVGVQIIPITGTAWEIDGDEKEKISYKKRTPHFEVKDDVSGGLHRFRKASKSGEGTITLPQTNPQNALMQALLLLSQNPSMVKLNLDLFTVRVFDRLTNLPKCVMRNTFIVEEPEETVEEDIPSTKWKIVCAQIQILRPGSLVLP